MRCNVRFEHEREELGRPNPLLACSACFALHPLCDFPDAFADTSRMIRNQGS